MIVVVIRKGLIVLLIIQEEKNELKIPNKKSSANFDLNEHIWMTRLRENATKSIIKKYSLSKDAIKARANSLGKTTINITGDTNNKSLQFSSSISPDANGILR